MTTEHRQSNKTPDFSLTEFSRFYSGTDRQALILFDQFIVGKQVVPYRIRNKNFIIEVAATTAFTLNIVFCNVLIEDGRHPLEIIMDQVRVEKTGKQFRIRFVNTLKEDAQKQSAFVFDGVESQVALWNYNFYTQSPAEQENKLPWCLLEEPIRALLAKHHYLGPECLNPSEERILPTVSFLDVVLGVFLHEKTRIAYGRSNIFFDAEVLEQARFDQSQIRAGMEILEYLGWDDIRQKLIAFETNREDFFKAMIRRLTQRDGKALYTWLTSNLSMATSEYPRLKQVLPVYAGNHQIIRSCIDRVLSDCGYEGAYPHFRKECNAGFIEISQVYERKYTYINEKKKLELISFIESIVNGCLTVTAVKGVILGRKKTDIYDAAMTAIDGCFTDQGRRRCQVAEVLTIAPEMTEAEVSDCTKDFVRKLVK